MKVTANIPDELVVQVESLARGKNLTQSLIKALTEWVNLEKFKQLDAAIRAKPLEFQEGFSAEQAREINRRIT